MAKFTVDTHLFRELGELLVGRDSTALAELIKNAYDADATSVTVYGESLDRPALGRIVITDDGLGMRRDQFENGFLRVASRFKEEGERRSQKFGRRYTGAKGIGRLAAHKLAHVLNVLSVPSDELELPDDPNSLDSVTATIDWDAIEQLETLDQIDGSTAITVVSTPPKPEGTRKPGTTITLSRLRRRWTQTDRVRFLSEINSFEAPQVVVKPPANIPSEELLFEQPRTRDETLQTGSKFHVELTGDFDTGEAYWQALAETAQWVIEIDALRNKSESTSDRGNPSNDDEESPQGMDDYLAKVVVKVLPTDRARKKLGAKPRRFEIDHPSPIEGPFFQARIFVRVGAAPSIERSWLREASGVRVFMEGFRVLPYGSPGDDWLGLDADYAARSTSQASLSKFGFSIEDPGEDEGPSIQPSGQYFGGVFCTAANSEGLTMLVNREGFLPNTSFETMKGLVRAAIDLGTRVRAQATAELNQQRREAREKAAAERASSKANSDTASHEEEPDDSEHDYAEAATERKALSDQITEDLERAGHYAAEARRHAADGRLKEAERAIQLGTSEVQASLAKTLRLQNEGSILRVLASVGLQLTAFVHEINALRNAARDILQIAERLTSDSSLSRTARRDASQLRKRFTDFYRDLERQSAYLIDVTSADARRRRSRQKLRERFEAAMRIVGPVVESMAIDVQNDIDPEFHTPPMFRSEITVVLTNILTNAVKAAGRDGHIKAHAVSSSDGIVLILQNTGSAVDLKSSEQLFRAFESSTVQVDPTLGQGMGMGLPITRNLLGEYGATIKFVRPERPFATAISIHFRGNSN